MDKVEASPGGTFSVKVTVTRRDYTGPITLAVVGLNGVTLADEVLKEKATNGTLKVTLPEAAAPGSLTHFRIVAKAKIGEREVHSATRTTPALKKLFPAMPFPPRELDGSIALGVKAKQ